MKERPRKASRAQRDASAEADLEAVRHRGCGREQAVGVESGGNERKWGEGGEGGHQSSKEKRLKGNADAGGKMQTFRS